MQVDDKKSETEKKQEMAGAINHPIKMFTNIRKRMVLFP